MHCELCDQPILNKPNQISIENVRLLVCEKCSILDNLDEYRNRIHKTINMRIPSNSSILDVGCGDGFDMLLYVRKGEIAIGLDVTFRTSWKKFKENPQAHFLISSALHLPFREDFFDFVFIKDILHHVTEPNKINWRVTLKQVFDESQKVAKINGNIVVIEANRYNPVSYLHMTRLEGHQHLTREHLQEILKLYSDSLSIKSVEAHFYPGKNRLLKKIIPIIEDILSKIPILNRFLSYNIAVIKNSQIKTT